MTLHALRLRLLPLSLAFVVFATAIPIELRTAQAWSDAFELGDFVQNMVLFVPLGAALARSRIGATMVVALGLSLTVELAQTWQFERFPSYSDLLSNVLGATLASLAVRRWRPGGFDTVTLDAWKLAAVAAMALAIVAMWAYPARPAPIADWDSRYALLIGNETTQDRPWSGRLMGLAIWDAAVDADGRAEPPVYADDQERVLTGGPGLALPVGAAERVAAHAMQAGRISIETTLAAANTTQDGPARIVTFSHDTAHRNFDLGQQGNRLVFRIRTPVSGANGEIVRAETDGVLHAGVPTIVLATYDGATARIYVDGQAHGRASLAAGGCRVEVACNSALPLLWTLLGAAAAMLAIASLPGIGAGSRVVIGLAAGALPIVIDRLVGLMPDVRPETWIAPSSLLGALAVVLSVVPPRAQASSAA